MSEAYRIFMQNPIAWLIGLWLMLGLIGLYTSVKAESKRRSLYGRKPWNRESSRKRRIK